MKNFKKFFENDQFDFQAMLMDNVYGTFHNTASEEFFRVLKNMMDIDNLSPENVMDFLRNKDIIDIPNYISDYKKPVKTVKDKRKKSMFKGFSSDDYCGGGDSGGDRSC